MLLKISASGELEKLSKDRVWIEIERSLRSPNASEFFTLLLNFKLHKPWLSSMSDSKCNDQNSAEIKWAELESKNNFKLGENLPVPNNFKMHVQLLEAMLDCYQESSEEDLIQSVERINFHRNMTEINALLNLEGLSKNKDFISKLGKYILEEDFTTLKEASKDEVRNVKLHLIKQAITKTYA